MATRDHAAGVTESHVTGPSEDVRERKGLVIKMTLRLKRKVIGNDVKFANLL